MMKNTDATTLRSLAKACGLKNIRIRKGSGCRRGAIHVFAGIDATREDRIAMVAFLLTVNAECRQADGKRIDLATMANPHWADSFNVVRWSR